MTIINPLPSPQTIVQHYFAAFSRGDIAGALELMTEDVVWHIDGTLQVSTVGLLRGKTQVKHWLTSFPMHFQPRVFTIDRLIESNDTAIALGRFRHTVISSGHTIGSDYAIRFTLRDGLIARYQIFEDSALLARAFDAADFYHQQQVRINGTRYAYHDRGEGPVIMFVHEALANQTDVDQYIESLIANYRCILVDMPVQTEHARSLSIAKYHAIAEDLALMIEELSLGPVIFIDMHREPVIGTYLATQYPRLVNQSIPIAEGVNIPSQLADQFK